MRFRGLIFILFFALLLNHTSCNKQPEKGMPYSKESAKSTSLNKIEQIKLKSSFENVRVELMDDSLTINPRITDSIIYGILSANSISNSHIEINHTPYEIKRIIDKHNTTVYSSLSKISDQKSISLSFSNDILTQSGDHYFTNGVRINYTSPSLINTPISLILHPYPFNGINEYGITLIHNIYTPHDPDSDELRLDDRPFAGILYLRFYKDTYDKSKNLSINSGLSLGVLGPLSQGGKIQRSFHGKQPDDWVYQISNTPMINYQIKLTKHLINSRLFDLSPSTSASIGTVYNNFSTGIHASFGNHLLYKGNNTKQSLFWNIFSTITYKYILYDASLSGSFLSKDNYGISNDKVLSHTYCLSTGLDLRYKQVQLSACYFYLSKEFNLGENHSWGEIKLAYIY
jgi:hypothetical protein